MNNKNSLQALMVDASKGPDDEQLNSSQRQPAG
jgi:hypothetical protein